MVLRLERAEVERFPGSCAERRILVSSDEKANREAWVGDMREGSTGESEHSRSRALRAPEKRGKKHAGEIGEIDTCVLGLALCAGSFSILLAGVLVSHSALCAQTRRWSASLFRVPTAAPCLLHVTRMRQVCEL